MCFTVFANSNSLISTHMGIFRNYNYFKQINKPHIALSMQLHGFAGEACKIAYPQIKYMVTKPADVMQKIMVQNMKDSGQIWIGSMIERYPFWKMAENRRMLNKVICENDFGRTIFKEFYFSEETKRNLSQDLKLHVCEKIKAKLQQMDPPFMPTNIYDLSPFIPANIYDLSPLDDRDASMWIITNTDGHQYPFARPQWFADHSHLTYGVSLYNVIISIDGLSEIWQKPANTTNITP